MDKLSEYIPLLIILVSFIVTIVGKKKKTAKVTQETTLPGKGAGEYMDEKKVIIPMTGSYQKITEVKSSKQVFQRHELQPGKEILSFSSEPIVIEPEVEESSFHFEEEDVVKAIIYAEIINKKEY